MVTEGNVLWKVLKIAKGSNVTVRPRPVLSYVGRGAEAAFGPGTHRISAC